VWQINVGTAGAAYYGMREGRYVPWRGSVGKFSVKPGYALFEVRGRRVITRFYTINGDLLGEVDLTAVRGVREVVLKPHTVTATVTETVRETTTAVMVETVTHSVLTVVEVTPVTVAKTLTHRETLTSYATSTESMQRVAESPTVQATLVISVIILVVALIGTYLAFKWRRP